LRIDFDDRPCRDLGCGELDELEAALLEPGCAFVSVGVDLLGEFCDLVVVFLGALGPAGQRLFGELAFVATEDAREPAESVQPGQLPADVLVGLALLVAEARELGGALGGLDSVVGERLDELVELLGLFGQRLARHVDQGLAGALDGLSRLRIDSESVFDRPRAARARGAL
jgi:hypothetical protein